MEKVNTKDGTLHVYAGIIITLLTGLGLYYLTDLSVVICCISGLLMGNIAGFFKEFIWDRMLKKGVFNWSDIMNTSWGTLVGLVILICVINFVSHR